MAIRSLTMVIVYDTDKITVNEVMAQIAEGVRNNNTTSSGNRESLTDELHGTIMYNDNTLVPYVLIMGYPNTFKDD